MGQKKAKTSTMKQNKLKKVGRPSREDLGLEPTQQVTLKVETSVIEILKEKHGSLSNALRAAAGQ